MRGSAAAVGLAALSACLEAPPRGVEGGDGDDGGAVPGRDGGGAVYRRALTIEEGSVTRELIDFPVLVRIAGDEALAGHATGAGDDIGFVDAAGETLAFQVERWSAGELIAWVKVPSVPIGDPTTFYLIYGPGAPRGTAQPQAVWDGGFAMVWHLEEAPADLVDSSSGGHGAVSVAGLTSSSDGHIGQGLLFDGLADYVDFGADLPAAVDAGSALTVTGWVRYDDKQDWAHWIAKASTNAEGWGLGIDFEYNFLVRTMNGDPFSRGWNAGAEPALDTWHHWAMVFDGGEGSSATRLVAYRDGAALPLTFDGSIPTSFDAGGGALYLGCASWNPTDYCIEGMVDEVRVSTQVRPGAWIDAEYENQREDSTFLVVGAEEEL